MALLDKASGLQKQPILGCGGQELTRERKAKGSPVRFIATVLPHSQGIRVGISRSDGSIACLKVAAA